MRTWSRYSYCNRTKGGGKNVIVMYTCKDNLIPLLYSGKIKEREIMKILNELRENMNSNADSLRNELKNIRGRKIYLKKLSLETSQI